MTTIFYVLQQKNKNELKEKIQKVQGNMAENTGRQSGFN